MKRPVLIVASLLSLALPVAAPAHAAETRPAPAGVTAPTLVGKSGIATATPRTGILAAAPSFSYALWSLGLSGKADLWKLDPASGEAQSRARISRPGIGAGWEATGFQIVDDTTGEVLVSRKATGQAALWQTNPDTGKIVRNVWLSRKGIGAGWQATSYVRANASIGYVLWTRQSSGEAMLWTIDPSRGAKKSVRRAVSPAKMGAGWQATSFQLRDPTTGSLLWTKGKTGQAQVRTMNLSNGAQQTGVTLASPPGIGVGWQARSFSQLDATTGSVLWTRSAAGIAAVWTIDSKSGAPQSGMQLGSPAGNGAGWQATGYAHGKLQPYALTVASSNPPGGVPIAVSPADSGSLGDGTTLFQRNYTKGTTVTLTAPATAGGNIFGSWTGCDSVTQMSCTVAMSRARTVTASFTTPPPPPVYTLAVASSGLAGGVSVAVSPADNGAQGDGTTPFERIYTSGALVQLMAPATAGGNIFGSWTGCDSVTQRSCTVAMSRARTVTASFTTPPSPVYTLAVASSGVADGVSVAVSPADNGAQGDGTTLFERTYTSGALVQLTAEATAGWNDFSSWTGCDSFDQRNCTVSMTGDKSVTANYVPRPLPACEQCHGTPPHPGLDGVGGTSDDAPEVMGNGTSASGVGGTPKPFDDGTWGYNVTGHGANGTAPQGSPIRPNVPCTGCHDVAQPATGNGRHLNGIVSSAKQGLNRSENTAHLIAAFIGGSSPTYSVQLTFDNACYTRCHAGARRADMRHSFVDPGDQYPPGVMVLGTHSTIEDGESLLWPVDSDLSTNASTSLPAFGTCVSCHNPHGTNAQPPTTPYYPSNYMVRANWPAPLCVVVCHN